jgi:hypothetical protein
MNTRPSRRAPLLAAVFCLAPLAAWTQDFEAWQGKAIVHEGEGGTKQVVEGIDVWDRGSPPRKFIVIGYIHDKRHKSGLIGKISMSHLSRDVAEVAKQAGGDAVMIASSIVDTVGSIGGGFSSTNASAQAFGNSAYGQAHTSSLAFAGGVRTQESEFAVLKYVQDAPASQAPASGDTPVHPATVKQ